MHSTKAEYLVAASEAFVTASLNVAPIRQILERWIHKYEAYWTNTLLRVKESAETETVSGRKTKRKKA